MKNILTILTCLMVVLVSLPSFAQKKDSKESAAKIIEKIINETGIEAANSKFDEILADESGKYILTEDGINDLGYRFIYDRKYREALTVLEMNARAFPKSWKVYSSLGEVYSWIEYFDQAVENLNKSLELNPKDEKAKKNLSIIRGTQDDFKNETKEQFRYKSGEQTRLKSPYFGQEPPGVEPEIFAPGIISTNAQFEFGCTFSPDGKEFYFTRRADDEGINVIMVSRWTENGWTAPDTVKFSKVGWNNEPHITPDGKKLYFGSPRPQPGSDKPSYGIWVMDRLGDSWSEPRFDRPGMYVTTTMSGSIYLTDISQDTEGGIVKIAFKDNEFLAPERLAGGVNTPTNGIHPCISPDESFLVFDCYRPEGVGGEGDLYVSFREKGDSWTEAINLGDKINTTGTDFCASLSPDGKYLFFTRSRDIYWVDAKIIEELKQRTFQ